ncbi:MAG TPA: MlaD family protein [Solirubrobacterales bacterium]|nr:MlaD family protein [Solirubrobacterales bacterium]
MAGRRTANPLAAIAASPTIIGAITTLIVVVAVFLAYNANNGLPFVPVYRVSVIVPNASRLAPNNEVTIGGTRVGVVETIEAVRLPEEEVGADVTATDPVAEGAETDGVVARLNLKLDESAAPIPENSIFRIRYKSTFGLKYLEITRGDGPPAAEGFVFNGTNDNDDPGDTDNQILSIDEVAENQGADDGTFVAQTEFDEIGNTFDQATRDAVRVNLAGYGDGFAARGESLNQAFAALNPLLTNLRPVAATLADPRTNLARFFPAIARTAAIVAPVAEQNAELFANLATTFDAIGADPAALQATISGGPPALQAGIDLLPAQRPFLGSVAELERRLRPGVRQLRLALPSLNGAIRVGTPVLARSAGTSRRLKGVFTELDRLVSEPATMSSLVRLGDLFDSAKPLAAHVTPAQTVCNYWNYLWTLLPEHLSERDSIGFSQRVSLIGTPQGPLTLNLDLDGPGGLPPVATTVPGPVETGLSTGGYSGIQANGKYGLGAPPPHTPGQFDPHELPILHAHPAAPTGQDGSDCQPGQTGYALGQLLADGQSPQNPAAVVADLPGDRGVTDVFWKQDGTRVLRDTRVESRQP